MIEIIAAITKPEFKIISELASKIWTEHYIKLIGPTQVEYMLNKFQSEVAIENQVIEGFRYFIAYYDKIPVGYLSFIKKDDSLFLSKIYVLSSERGKGVGKTMMEFLLQKAVEMHLKSISLTVNKNNTAAIKAYEKMGFANIESIVINIGGGYVMDDFKMIKSL